MLGGGAWPSPWVFIPLDLWPCHGRGPGQLRWGKEAGKCGQGRSGRGEQGSVLFLGGLCQKWWRSLCKAPLVGFRG